MRSNTFCSLLLFFLLAPFYFSLAQGITITDNKAAKSIEAPSNSWIEVARFTLGEGYSVGNAALSVSDLAADIGNKASFEVNITFNRLTGGATAQWNYISHSKYGYQSGIEVYQDGYNVSVYQYNADWGSRVNSATITGTALRATTTATLYPSGNSPATRVGTKVEPVLPLLFSKKLTVSDISTSYDKNNMLVGGPVIDFGQSANDLTSVGLLKINSFNGSGAIGVTYNQTYNADMVFGVNNGYWDPNNPALANVIERMRIKANGNVGIGTTNPGNYKLAVEGKIGAREVKVTLDSWADFVFEPTYKLRSLAQVEKYIEENKHLPDVPSAKQVEKDGVELGKMDAILLQKIEELTLYIIEQDKQMKSMKEELNSLKSKK